MASEATTQAEHQVEGGLLLNVVVRESATVLELISSENQALLIGRDALLVLDLGLHISKLLSFGSKIHLECLLLVDHLLNVVIGANG